jgi:hypothetical protein
MENGQYNPREEQKKNGAWFGSMQLFSRKMPDYKESGHETKGRDYGNGANSGSMQMAGMKMFLLRGKLSFLS